MVLLFDKEKEGRKLQWQRAEKNAYYEELKPINNVDKECIDKHKSDSEILQYDNDKASVECEGSDNEE